MPPSTTTANRLRLRASAHTASTISTSSTLMIRVSMARSSVVAQRLRLAAPRTIAARASACVAVGLAKKISSADHQQLHRHQREAGLQQQAQQHQPGAQRFDHAGRMHAGVEIGHAQQPDGAEHAERAAAGQADPAQLRPSLPRPTGSSSRRFAGAPGSPRSP